MGKRWTDEELALMRAHYESAEKVEIIVEMLGRPKDSVMKKAVEIGLRRPDLHEESIKRLMSVLSDRPMLTKEVAKALGMSLSATNNLLRKSCADGLCHVASRSPLRAEASWVAGPGDNDSILAPRTFERKAQKAEKERRQRIMRELERPAFRHPQDIAFFGMAKPVLSTIPRRIYRQDMTVTQDEEIAA